MHTEEQGVVAIDQTGMKGSGMATRLYIYPDIQEQVIHLITLGDKGTQKRRDLVECRMYMKQLQAKKSGG